MNETPVIEVSEAELDEVYGGKETALCVQSTEGACTTGAGCCAED